MATSIKKDTGTADKTNKPQGDKVIRVFEYKNVTQQGNTGATTTRELIKVKIGTANKLDLDEPQDDDYYTDKGRLKRIYSGRGQSYTILFKEATEIQTDVDDSTSKIKVMTLALPIPPSVRTAEFNAWFLEKMERITDLAGYRTPKGRQYLIKDIADKDSKNLS